MMRLPKHSLVKGAAGALAQSLEGFRYVRNHPRVLTILSLFAVVGIFGWSYSVLMPALRTMYCISKSKAMECWWPAAASAH